MDNTLGSSSALLVDFGNMWYHITFWAVITSAVIYFGAGILALRVLKYRNQYAWIPLAAAFLGVVVGFLLGSIPALLLAAVYSSIPYSIGADLALGLGLGESVLITYFQLGRADFTHDVPSF